MQDRTINNAFLALAKQGGAQGKVAEGLLVMRGVEWSGVTQEAPLGRGKTRGLIMRRLASGPKTAGQITKCLLADRPELAHRSAHNRVYQALLRLEEKKMVRRDGRLWVLAQ